MKTMRVRIFVGLFLSSFLVISCKNGGKETEEEIEINFCEFKEQPLSGTVFNAEWELVSGSAEYRKVYDVVNDSIYFQYSVYLRNITHEDACDYIESFEPTITFSLDTLAVGTYDYSLGRSESLVAEQVNNGVIYLDVATCGVVEIIELDTLNKTFSGRLYAHRSSEFSVRGDFNVSYCDE